MAQVRPLRSPGDLAADVARLLASGAHVRRSAAGRRRRRGTGEHPRAGGHDPGSTCPCTTVPSVTAGAGSVYATRAGEDWLTLLEALEQPPRAGRVRAAALTPFLGRTAAELDGGGEADRRAGRHAAGMGRPAAVPRRGCGSGVSSSPSRACRAGCWPSGRRAAADRPAAPGRRAAGGGRAGGARAGRVGRLAAPPSCGGGGGPEHGADPPAGQRCRRGAGADAARQQGPAVPGGLPAVRLRPLGQQRTEGAAVARRCRAAGCWTSADSAPTGRADRERQAPPRWPARRCGCCTSG